MLLKHILALVTFVPFVVSTQCKKGDFWWGDKGCCLPKGGPPNPPSPPAGTKCPKDTHYWGKDKDCCVPRQPEPTNPKCPTNWEWNWREHKCKPRPTPPSPPSNHPSPRPGHQKKKNDDQKKKKDDDKKNKKDDHKNGHYKRSTRAIRCPSGLEACPVSGFAGHYECFDTATELESCGGCATLGQGQDCTKIEGAWNVACERGYCKVYSCEGGYRLDAIDNACVPL